MWSACRTGLSLFHISFAKLTYQSVYMLLAPHRSESSLNAYSYDKGVLFAEIIYALDSCVHINVRLLRDLISMEWYLKQRNGMNILFLHRLFYFSCSFRFFFFLLLKTSSEWMSFWEKCNQIINNVMKSFRFNLLQLQGQSLSDGKGLGSLICLLMKYKMLLQTKVRFKINFKMHTTSTLHTWKHFCSEHFI